MNVFVVCLVYVVEVVLRLSPLLLFVIAIGGCGGYPVFSGTVGILTSFVVCVVSGGFAVIFVGVVAVLVGVCFVPFSLVLLTSSPAPWVRFFVAFLLGMSPFSPRGCSVGGICVDIFFVF